MSESTHQMYGDTPRTKYKKIHVEIAPLSWKLIEAEVDAYNNDPSRVTPDIKADHIINEALDRYLSGLDIFNEDEARHE